MQDQQFSGKSSSSHVASDIAKKAMETVQPKTRVVKLRSQSCCGCGCDDVTVVREVAYDSPLQDGDYISSKDWLSTDKIE